MRRSSFEARKIARRGRRPAELLLVPMIDIFIVLVTFLLMTAVFSRTVILELNLPAQLSEFREPPKGLQLEVIVRKGELIVADRNSGPLAPLPSPWRWPTGCTSSTPYRCAWCAWHAGSGPSCWWRPPRGVRCRAFSRRGRACCGHNGPPATYAGIWMWTRPKSERRRRSLQRTRRA